MNQWKKAYWLARFELKESKINLFFSFLLTLFLMLYVISQLSSYLNDRDFAYDVIFILLFSFAPTIVKPKSFQMQNIYPDFIGSPIIFMQQNLPVKEDVLIKSRLIIYAIYTFPFQFIALLGLILLTPLIDSFSLINTLAFMIIWLSFNIYVGFIFPASEVGDQGIFATTAGLAIIIIVVGVVGMILYVLFYMITGHGLVYWSIELVEKLPIISCIVSVFLAFIGNRYWQFYMKKKMHKLDYM